MQTTLLNTQKCLRGKHSRNFCESNDACNKIFKANKKLTPKKSLTHGNKNKLLTLDCELPVVVLRMLNIGHSWRTLPHHGKSAPFSSFVPFPFHITPTAFCMSVCRTVSTALRIRVSFSVICGIFRIIRVILMVRYVPIHTRRMVRAERH